MIDGLWRRIDTSARNGGRPPLRNAARLRERPAIALPVSSIVREWVALGIRWSTIVCVCLFFVGCGAAATKIFPTRDDQALRTSAACERLFPRAGFELSSVVEASIPFSDDASLLAVVTAPADQHEFRSVLLTQDGVVIFDAVRRGDHIDVKRALPSLNAASFGRKMTDDIRLLVMRPRGTLREVGTTDAGKPICRVSEQGRQVEIVLAGDREAELVEIINGDVTRRAWMKQIEPNGRAKEIVLDHPGITGYRLRLLLQTFDESG